MDNDILEQLVVNDKNRVMQSSFFDSHGFPKPFFRPILDANKNSLKAALKSFFPYSVEVSSVKSTDLESTVNAKHLWISFYGEINFENEEDAKVLKTFLKLLV